MGSVCYLIMDVLLTAHIDFGHFETSFFFFFFELPKHQKNLFLLKSKDAQNNLECLVGAPGCNQIEVQRRHGPSVLFLVQHQCHGVG